MGSFKGKGSIWAKGKGFGVQSVSGPRDVGFRVVARCFYRFFLNMKGSL